MIDIRFYDIYSLLIQATIMISGFDTISVRNELFTT